MSKSQEKESVIYARISNPAGLWKAAEIIHQEQAQVKAPKGNIRVRAERNDKATAWSYELTTKHFKEAAGGVKDCIETTEVCTKKQYDMFKSVCDVFMRKTRFVFFAEKLTVQKPGMTAEVVLKDVKYEVDVFYKADGTVGEWCKIDLELQSIQEQLAAAGLNITDLQITARVSHLPFGPEAAFIDDGVKHGPKRELVNMIYGSDFLRDNDDVVA